MQIEVENIFLIVMRRFSAAYFFVYVFYLSTWLHHYYLAFVASALFGIPGIY